MGSDVDPRLSTLLGRPLPRRDRPTDTHYTFEVTAYWEDDFLDAVRAGLRRRIVVGGLRSAGRGNLAVELPAPLRPYSLARLRGRTARLVFPAAAEVALRSPDGALGVPRTEPTRGLPVEAARYDLAFDEALAFRYGTLSFVCRFVHRDGRPRQPLDWMRALRPGSMD